MSPRPVTLKDVAERSSSLEEFGRNLRDWLHELRRASSRKQALAAVAEAPPLLSGRFESGRVADAWLAAYADHLAGGIGLAAPVWAAEPERSAETPVFDEGGEIPALRALALAQSPAAFRRRNLFTPTVDLPLRLRAGRPSKTLEEKRRTNAERQRRFRKARLEELQSLRRAVAAHPV